MFSLVQIIEAKTAHYLSVLRIFFWESIFSVSFDTIITFSLMEDYRDSQIGIRSQTPPNGAFSWS